ncbi:MASE3 domain-containing protein [Desulfocastanea catecholica]
MILTDDKHDLGKKVQLIITCLFLSAALIGLYFTNRVNFLLFHSLAEVFSIVVAFSIFVIAWNSKRYIRNPYLLFVGIACLFVALLDLLHALAYKGMPIFPEPHDYATELWIAARYMESITLLLAFIFLRDERVPRVNRVFTVYTLITGIIIAVIFYWKIFPICFVDGSGLTPFKKISEYIICAILLAAIFFLRKNKEKFESKIFRCLLLSIFCTIISELAFTFYISSYDVSNLIGHYFKIFSYLLIYQAIIKTGIERPFTLIFRDLDRANRELSRQTAELEATNKQVENDKRMLSAVMQALPTGVAITDISGGTVLTNKVYETLWGGALPETSSVDDYHHYRAWWTDTDKPVAKEEWASAIAVREERDAIGQMMRIERFDGSEAYIINSACPVYDADGNISGSAVAIQDITDLKQAENALFESEQQLRLFIEHAPAALAMFDRNMCYQSVSRRWLNDYGLGDRDLTGISIYDASDIPERWREAHNRALAGEVLGMEEDYYELPEGPVVWLRWEIRPWYGKSGEIGGIVIFTEDITPRKQAEEQLKILNEELERRVEQRTHELQETQLQYLHAEKLSAIGKLSASIAHEFNNPLQGILTILKGLKRRAILEEEDKELLDLAISENERMKNLIRSLQDFNRPSSGKRTTMDIHAAIDSLLLLYKSDFKHKGISLSLNYAEELPLIPAVPDQIKQVLLNLITNAADASAQNGGEIAITTRQVDDRVAIAIQDFGTGIEPENIDLIFQPFYTTKSSTMGTGLGLSICQSIIQKHQGEIRVESRPGEGSTFTVLLPLFETDKP